MKMLLRIAFTVWGVLLSFGVQAHSKSPAPLPSADSVRTDSTKAHALREATVKPRACSSSPAKTPSSTTSTP